MQTKLAKITADTKFMRTYKEEYSVPTSANAKLAIRHGNKKLKTEISLIMESELQNKYEEKKKIRKQMMMMMMMMMMTLYNSVIHQVKLAHKSKLKVMNK